MHVLMVNRVKPGVGPEELGKVIPTHVEWLKEKMAEGLVSQAGKWGDIGGMTLVRAGSVEEARELLEKDPLLMSGLVEYDVAEFFPMVEMK